MCLGLFLASDAVLPLFPFTEARPAFNVAPLRSYEEPVRAQFSHPNVVYLGASTGCGCGFDPNGSEAESSAADREADRRALADYLVFAAGASPLELFVCWDGDYTAPADRRLTIEVSELAMRTDWLAERSYTDIPKRAR